MKTLLAVALALAVFFAPAPKAHAYLLVEDIPHLAQSIVSQIVNYVQYLEHTVNQLTQITYQVEQLTQQIIALKRFGDPQYYVHLLHLDELMASVSALENGVGNTDAEFCQLADGHAALGYTADGIYSDYSGLVDRWGDPIQWETNAFKKFGVVNDMYQAFDQSLVTYNQQNRILEHQLAQAIRNHDNAATQMETAKYQGQILAIKAQMDVLAHQTALKAARLSVQEAQNRNDAARTLEAERQRQLQERVGDLRNDSRVVGGWISPDGAQDTGGALP